MVHIGGCGSDTTGPRSPAVTQTYWALQLNQHAITMAVVPPYNTIQLTATAVTATGIPVVGAGRPTYKVSETTDTTVKVDSTGAVTARYANEPDRGPSFIVASLTVQGVTLVDSAMIAVTSTAPAAPLATFSIQPPPDSLAVYQAGGWIQAVSNNSGFLPFTAVDRVGNPINKQDMALYLRSSNSEIAGIGSNSGPARGWAGFFTHPFAIFGNAQGQVTIYVQTWFYGVSRQDSLSLQVGYNKAPGRYPTQVLTFRRTPFNSLTPQLYFWPSNLDIGAGGAVSWVNNDTSLDIDVAFDDSAHVHPDSALAIAYSNGGFLNGFFAPDTITGGPGFQGGNIARFRCLQTSLVPLDTSQIVANNYPGSMCYPSLGGPPLASMQEGRTFPIPGTYTYHSRLYGTGGVIVVHPN